MCSENSCLEKHLIDSWSPSTHILALGNTERVEDNDAEGFGENGVWAQPQQKAGSLWSEVGDEASNQASQ